MAGGNLLLSADPLQRVRVELGSRQEIDVGVGPQLLANAD